MARQGNRVRVQRCQRGWSQAELARRAGLCQPNVSLYERGKVFPDPPTLERLATAFGVSPGEVYHWLREPAAA